MPLAPQSFLYRHDPHSGVATITLNRPDRLNALTFDVYRELRDAFGALDDEPGVRAVVMAGAGRAFCSGGDVEDIIGALFGRDEAGLLEFTRLTCDLILAMRQCRRPVVGALNGTVAGAGAVMAAACDVRVAAESAKIAFLFTKVGLSGADMGAAWLLPRIVGLGLAAELLMTGDFIDAQTALRIGLYNRVVAHAEVMGEARGLPEPAADTAARAQARDLVARLGRAGWFASIGELDLRAACLVRETLAGASPLADAMFALQALGTVPILLAGHAPLKERWLPAVLAGRAIAAFAMTEPEAGSDAAAIATTARRDGTGYVLRGTKTFISNAGIADFYTVFASTDQGKGHKGISAFVVAADTPGLKFVRPLVLSAPHPLGEIAFEDSRVPASDRLGAEGEGNKLGLATLDRLRATVAAAACGMAARALQEALAHATRRRQFGHTLGEFQLIQEKLARMATDLTAARLLTYRAAWEKDRGADRVTLEAAMAKAFATEAAQRIVDDAVQILGGRGVLAAHPVDRLYRALRALLIYEGPTEIQHLIVAGHLFERPGREGAA